MSAFLENCFRYPSPGYVISSRGSRYLPGVIPASLFQLLYSMAERPVEIFRTLLLKPGFVAFRECGAQVASRRRKDLHIYFVSAGGAKLKVEMRTFQVSPSRKLTSV